MNGLLKKTMIAAAFLVAAAGAALAWYSHASQPRIEGRIKLDGLGAQVDVVRDAEGVPHIYARSATDAYFALGFVHAQDRLWQLELNRRVAAGRISELLGTKTVDTDRFLRTLGVRRNAEKILTRLSPETRAVLDAYARGINAYLSQRSGPLPPEFLLTGAPAPQPWQPVDSIGWQTMMAWDLGTNWTQEIMRMRLSQRLPLERINDFLPPYPGDARLKTQDYTAFYRSLSGTTQQLVSVAGVAPPSYVEGMGSNGWAVSGAFSSSGKPLLANDPHLALSAPSLWYLAHLSAPGLNVIGATLPGLPAVVLGHNDRIAWGFTNTGSDVQDLFIERINPVNPMQYQAPGGWVDFAIRTEVIKVKGQKDVVMEARETRHGPVISGVLPVLDRASVDANNFAVALAWTALRPDDLTVQAGINFNRAENWDQFLSAARDFSSPQLNMVYADVDSNVGYAIPGRVPIRKAENDLKGLAPAPGWDARYDWDGFIPFDRLPRQYNPASRRIVTANQKAVPDGYPYFLTSEWALPYRADRIAILLDAVPKHSIETFASIQKDNVSLAAQELLPILRKTVPRSSQARLALEKLAAWNGAMAADQPEPLIFNAWLAEISRRMFMEPLGAALMSDYWEQRTVQLPMVQALKAENGQGRWCGGEKTSPDTDACGRLLTEALEASLSGLEERYGSGLSKWRWGDAHAARSEHRPFGKVDLLSKLFDIRVPTPGDTFSINVGRYSLRDEKEPFANRHAAGFRALYDLSDLENSRFMQSTGQSGNVLSPLYRNYARRWSEVSYLPMKMKRESIEKEHLGTLILMP